MSIYYGICLFLVGQKRRTAARQLSIVEHCWDNPLKNKKTIS